MLTKNCKRCSTEYVTKSKAAKYCEDCKILNKKEDAARRYQRNKKGEDLIKHCLDCGIKIDIVNKPNTKRCKECSLKASKISHKKYGDIYREEKLGQKVGVGSGNNQGEHTTHHSYKNGTGSYRTVGKKYLGQFCNRCNVNINFEKRGMFAIHHKDHDRKNNDLNNLELLCKRCHQLEHECWKQLPNNC